MKLNVYTENLLLTAEMYCAAVGMQLKEALEIEPGTGNALDLVAAINALYDARQLINKAQRLLK